jgi:HlyD family type I secretion membrane fusion protein
MTGPAEQKRRWSAAAPLWIGWLGLAVLVVGVGGWSVLTNITGAVIAMGQIEVDQNRQVVQHPDGGVVAEILVQEADVVAEGDLLIRLDSEQLSSELAVVEGQLLEVLARRARFEAERDGADALMFDALLRESLNADASELMEGSQTLFEARRLTAEQETEQLARRRDQIGDQIDGVRAQQAAITTQLGLIDQELIAQQSLLELQREQANLQGRMGELTAAVAQSEARITETDIEILRIGSTRREEAITRLRDLQFNEIELRENRRALLTRLDRLDIRAPVAGIVYGMQVFAPRSVIRPADPVMFLVPQDRPLIITAQIETTNIDQVFLGQEVALRFSAFDQRRTPELFGHVVQLSADAFTDEASRLSFYRAQIALNEGEAARLPEDMVMIPGMPVEAFISTDERTPLEYLLKPFTDYFAKVFRET